MLTDQMAFARRRLSKAKLEALLAAAEREALAHEVHRDAAQGRADQLRAELERRRGAGGGPGPCEPGG
jgi:hypothetical protein